MTRNASKFIATIVASVALAGLTAVAPAQAATTSTTSTSTTSLDVVRSTNLVQAMGPRRIIWVA